MLNKLIINFTPTGVVPTKKQTPYVPISPTEIIEQIHEAYELGITIAHIHARDSEGEPDFKAETYDIILTKLKKICPDLLTCLSLSGRFFPEFEKRSEAIELSPDMASLTLGSLNFKEHGSINTPDMILKLLDKMNKYGVNPELEVFDIGMVNYANYLIKKELVKPPYYFNLLFGNIFSSQSDLAQIGLILKEIPKDAYWSMAGIGKTQLQTNTTAIAYGGGVRVGLEDNIYYDAKQSVLAKNIDLLKRIHKISEIFERPIMTSSDFGKLGFYNKNR